MATTYNNLYLDARKRLRAGRRGGRPAGGAGAGLLCGRQEPGAVLPGHGPLCLRPGGGEAGGAAGAAAGRGAGGLPHRGVGVLWPAPGYHPRRADPPDGHRGAGRAGHPAGPGRRRGGEGAGSVRRERLRGSGGGCQRARLPGGAGRCERGGPPAVQAECPPQRAQRPGDLRSGRRPGAARRGPVGFRRDRLQPALYPHRGYRGAGRERAGLRAPLRPGRRGRRPGLLPGHRRPVGGRPAAGRSPAV